MASYWELLRHPLWQEKRLRVMERAGFSCERCRNGEQTLNVHHAYYTKGAKPWEYPDDALRCLCEPCHEECEQERKLLLVHLPRISKNNFQRLLGFARYYESDSVAESSDYEDVPDFSIDSKDVFVGALSAALLDGHQEYWGSLDSFASKFLEFSGPSMNAIDASFAADHVSEEISIFLERFGKHSDEGREAIEDGTAFDFQRMKSAIVGA